jgi:hypothetical protein
MWTSGQISTGNSDLVCAVQAPVASPLCGRLLVGRVPVALSEASHNGGERKMKRRIIQRWTPSDDECLRKFAAEGRSSLTIAEWMKRSRVSIYNRAKKLKIVMRALKEVNEAPDSSNGFAHGPPSLPSQISENRKYQS